MGERLSDVLQEIADEIERELICCPDDAPCCGFCRGAQLARQLVLNPERADVDVLLAEREKARQQAVQDELRRRWRKR